MTDLRKAAEQALKYFEDAHGLEDEEVAIREALRQALEKGGHEPYDQTALELCEKCGWKAIIPDEGCLVCARNEQEPVGYVTDSSKSAYILLGVDLEDDTPLYAAPPKGKNGG